MQLDVVTYGDLVADLVVRVPRLPLCANETQLTHSMALEPGGAGNFLVMAQRLGLKSGGLGLVGNDAYGQLMLEKLREEGVDVFGVRTLAGRRTTLVMVLIDDAGEHVFLGVLGGIQVQAVELAFREKITAARAFFTNGYAFVESSPAHLGIDLIDLAREGHHPVFLDPGPQVHEVEGSLLREAISKTDGLFLTQEEAAVLVGEKSAAATVDDLLALGAGTVALKLGPQGCLVADQQTRAAVAAFSVPVVDTCGAGDAFDAAFVYGSLHGLALEERGRLANAAGAAATQHIGAGTALPQPVEIERIYGAPLPKGY